jgi:hypothetical protein
MIPSPDNYQPSSNLLENRVILVTGAGQAGARGRDSSARATGPRSPLWPQAVKLEATYDAITAAGGPEPALVPLDLATAGAPSSRPSPSWSARI